MRKASFLKLNGMYAGKDTAEDILLHYVVQERIFEQIEDPYDQIRPVGSCLAWKQFRCECFP